MAVELRTEAELSEQQEEVHLRDAKLDVLALRRRLPLERSCVLDLEDLFDLRTEDAALVDPAAEPRRDRHVGAGRDDAARDLLDVGDVLQDAGERVLTRRLARRDRAELVRNGVRVDTLRRRSMLLAQALGRGHADASRRGVGREACPLVTRVGQLRSQLIDLRRREDRGVVHGMPRHRQPPTLDREGEDHSRTRRVRVGAVQRRDHVAEVVPTAVADQRGQRRVLVGLEYACKCLTVGRGRVLNDELADVGAALAQEALILRIRHLIDAALQRLAALARKGLAQLRAVLHDLDLPAMIAEDMRELLRAHAGDHAVQALAVEVDDPGELTEATRGRIGERLPDVALIELGIAHQRHEAATGLSVEMRVDVAIDHAREERCSRSQAHGPGREVDGIRILRARRVRLQTTERAQRREVLAIQTTEQVVDRVQHRRGVRLDGDAVTGLQPVEVQRRHRRDHRRRGGLMAADLEVVIGRALVVGVVDHARRQPEHASLNCVKRLQLVGRQFGARRRDGHGGSLLASPALRKDDYPCGSTRSHRRCPRRCTRGCQSRSAARAAPRSCRRPCRGGPAARP